jgi:hypothetical protein
MLFEKFPKKVKIRQVVRQRSRVCGGKLSNRNG